MPASVNAEQHTNVVCMKMWKALALLFFCDHLVLLREFDIATVGALNWLSDV